MPMKEIQYVVASCFSGRCICFHLRLPGARGKDGKKKHGHWSPAVVAVVAVAQWNTGNSEEVRSEVGRWVSCLYLGDFTQTIFETLKPVSRCQVLVWSFQILSLARTRYLLPGFYDKGPPQKKNARDLWKYRINIYHHFLLSKKILNHRKLTI